MQINATIICVTCYRDWRDFFRQAVSFEKYLPDNINVIYVIEDTDPANWINCWNRCHLKHTMTNVTIVFSNSVLSTNTSGWVRQQLIKLIVTSQQTTICWVVDSKNFLIKSPVGELGNSQLVDIKNESAHMPVIDMYNSILNISETCFLLPHTPFEINPVYVKHMIDSFGGINKFSEWFVNLPYYSEFFLYQAWCYKHKFNINISARKSQLVKELWAPTTPDIGDSILKSNQDIAELSTNEIKFTWILKHRWAGIFWNHKIKNAWNTFLIKHQLPISESTEHDQFLFLEFCRHKASIGNE